MKNRTHLHALDSKGKELLLEELLSPFASGQQIDAAEIIAANPHIRQTPSLMVDLAYEEFWSRIRAGEEVDRREFVATFPEVQDQLLRLINAGDIIQRAPELFLGTMEPEWPQVPSEIGKFRLEKLIGSGAFSRVYFARDLSLPGRCIVLKATRNSVREIDSLGWLQHPNIISPHGVYEDLIAGFTVIAMPFHGCATLSDLIDLHHNSESDIKLFDYASFLKQTNSAFADVLDPVPACPRMDYIQTVCWIGAQIAEGLDYAHQKGFFHCDIKPSNILLRNDGKPVILDFNLCVSVTEHSKYAGGTFAYMSPEHFHALGSAANLGASSDVYSLGATLIEIIQGSPLFAPPIQGTVTERQHIHPLEIGDKPYRLDAGIRTRLGKALAALLESCVSRSPDLRPTCRQLSHDLKDYAAPQQSFSRRYRKSILLGAMLLVALAYSTNHSFPLKSSVPPTAEQSFQAGLHSLTILKVPATAVEHFTHTLEIDPNRIDARILRACALIQLNNLDRAEVDLKLAQAKCPSGEISSLIGYVQCKFYRQYLIADFEYDKAVDANIHRLDVVNNSAFCKGRLAKLSEAMQLLKPHRDLLPTSPALLCNWAEIEFNNSQALRLQPDTAYADMILRDPTLSKSRLGLDLAAGLYCMAGKYDPQLYGKAVQVVEEGRNCGMTRDFVMHLPLPSLLKDSLSQGFPAIDKPILSDAAPIELLIPPPVEDPNFLAHLLQSLQDCPGGSALHKVSK